MKVLQALHLPRRLPLIQPSLLSSFLPTILAFLFAARFSSLLLQSQLDRLHVRDQELRIKRSMASIEGDKSELSRIMRGLNAEFSAHSAQPTSHSAPPTSAEAALVWTDDALATLSSAPFFVRSLARRRTEAYAKARGCEVVTEEVVLAVKEARDAPSDDAPSVESPAATVPSPLSDCTITAVSPSLFSQLRRHAFRVPASRHRLRMSGDFQTFKSNSKGAASAGTLFFFSGDGKYMLKTVPRRERDALVGMIEDYAQYMRRHRRSLLTRFLGLYDVTLTDETFMGGKRTKTYSLVVMNNVFPKNVALEERYDLKGSTAGRTCGQEEREEKGPRAILKDNDLQSDVVAELEEGGEAYASGSWGFSVGHRQKDALMWQLRKDCEFLQSVGVMDYSLLVGVKAGGGRGCRGMRWARDLFVGAGRDAESELSVLRGTRKKEKSVFFVGLIDFLSPWNTRKWCERKIKSWYLEVATVSCAPPAFYAQRFLAFLAQHFT